jgi:hypothetical protein
MLVLATVSAEEYVKTGAKDFNVFVDKAEELNGFVYATVNINQTTEDFKCVDMLFFDNGTSLVHIQSNPPHSPQDRLAIFSNPANSPETLGYFPIFNGVGNIYFRDKDVVPYNNFTLVVLCNSANGTQLVYEEDISPVWRTAFKELPSRGVWFARDGNGTTIIVVGVVLIMILMFVYFRLAR